MEKLHFWHLQHWHEKTMEILSLCKKTPTLSISDRWTVTFHFCHAFLPACVYISSKNNFPFVMLLSGSLLFRLLSTWRCPHRPRRPNKLWPNTGTPCRAPVQAGAGENFMVGNRALLLLTVSASVLFAYDFVSMSISVLICSLPRGFPSGSRDIE